MKTQKLHTQLVSICEQIAKGQYEEAKSIFKLTPQGQPDDPTNVLLEAFAMMLVRLEAREFELERLFAEMAETGSGAHLRPKSALPTASPSWPKLYPNNKKQHRQTGGLKASGDFIAQDQAMQILLHDVQRAAMVDSNVLITGETGTGKGLWAGQIHSASARAGQPFVTINCAAIPATLLESELFGIEAGVASGVQARPGRFEQAGSGTIFLDEIGDLPLESQPKLLHVIESGQLERVGGRKPIPMKARIIAATHQNLEEQVENRLFRADLFYRLNVMRFHVPSLRERPSDLPALIKLILGQVARRSSFAASSISPEAVDLLLRHTWPGNIRELQNELERAALLAEDGIIKPENFSKAVTRQVDAAQKEQGFQSPADGASGKLGLEDMEAIHIKKVLKLTHGNKSEAARLLGISREGLRIKLERINERFKN